MYADTKLCINPTPSHDFQGCLELTYRDSHRLGSYDAWKKVEGLGACGSRMKLLTVGFLCGTLPRGQLPPRG